VLGRIQPLALAGKSRSDIAAELGVSADYVKRVFLTPARYVRGHVARDARRKVPTVLRSRATLLNRSSGVLRSERQEYVRQLKAFELEGMAASFSTPASTSVAIAALIRQRYAEVRAEERQMRALEYLRQRERGRIDREVVRDQIDYLRNLVGVGWKRDADPPGRRLLSLNAMAEADGNFLDWFEFRHPGVQAEDLEREHAAARAVMASPSLWNLVQVALNSPRRLEENDREVLRDHYLRAYDGGVLA
jgi:hypothetical protein